MITAIPAAPRVDTAIALSNLGRLTLSAQGANSSLFVPGVIVNLGAPRSSPITYNAAGLFASLLQIAASPPDGNTAVVPNGTVTELAALLGFDATAASSGFLTPAVAAQSLPATTVAALQALLARNTDNGGAALSVDQALARLLAINLNTTSRQDGSNAVADVTTLNDLLQGLPAERRAAALNNLLSSGLGLAATTPATNSTAALSSETLFPGLPATATEQDLLQLIAAGAAPATTTQSGNTTAELVRSAVAASASVTPVADTTPNTPPEALPAIAGQAPATAAATATASAPAAPAAVASNTNTTSANNSDQALKFLVDSATQATANISGNPAYASIAAAFYLSAARFQAQQAAIKPPANLIQAPRPITAASAVAAI